MAQTELELIRRLKQRDPEAFHSLVDGYGQRLYGLAHRLLGNAEDARDVVQETLAAAFGAIGAFEQRSTLWTWLAKILVRQAARWRRSNHRREVFSINPESPLAASPSQETDAKADVTAAIEQLVAEHREVIVLRELERLSYVEISQVLGVPLGTVESRLFRARIELRQLLKDWKP